MSELLEDPEDIDVAAVLAAARDRVWSSAREFLARLVALWVGPDHVVEQERLTREERDEILGWLGPLETLARSLLIAVAPRLEAAEAEPGIDDRPPLFPLRRPSAASGFRFPAAIPDSPAPAALWRVSFRAYAKALGVAPPPPEVWRSAVRGRVRAVEAQEPLDGFNPMPLARRFEAARRVIEDPYGCAVALLNRALPSPRGGPSPTEVRQAVALRAVELVVEEAEALIAETRGAPP